MADLDKVMAKRQAEHLDRVLDLTYMTMTATVDTHVNPHVSIIRHKTAQHGKIKHVIELEYDIIEEVH